MTRRERTVLLRRRALAVAVLSLIVAACVGAEGATRSGIVPSTRVARTSNATPSSTAAPATTSSTTSTTAAPTFDVIGTVTTAEGTPLPAAAVTLWSETVTTDATGSFALSGVRAGLISITRPGWMPASVEFDGTAPAVSVALEPRIVRALRVSRNIAGDPEAFSRTLELAAASTVNALVFDTKDESGAVLYETNVSEAHAIGAVRPLYDPIELLSAAQYRDLYTITRVVSFEDDYRADARPELKLYGDWVDAANPRSWEYPLDLAVEACGLGFDEIQFDYVRFPTADGADALRPQTQTERTAAIAAFLTEAVARLHPLGCAVSAAIFGIVLSAGNDQGTGQRPEDLAGIIDAVSPMLYPSHYSDGWLGFDEPNDHPGPVIADALDDGAPRFGELTIMRPWLQAFYYNGSQVLAQIEEAESRGFGWILWNALGNYELEWLPSDTSGSR